MNYLKMIPWLLGGLALAGLLWIVNGWRLDSKHLPLVEKDLENQKATIAQIQHDAQIVNAASESYQAELARIRAEHHVPIVRLCKPSTGSGVQVPTAQPGSDGTPAAGGVVSEGVGPDIGPALYAIARRADELSAQTRGLQKAADELAPN